MAKQEAQRGRDVLTHPAQNRDAAFDQSERELLGLHGLLPWRVVTIEEQVALELEHLRRKGDDMERYIGLAALQDRNETLFYRLLMDHLEELAPIVYTPTVGRACREFSHVVRRPRGVWITPDDIDRLPELLRNSGQRDVRLIVATDNERILGLGDQGAGGMGIPVGKLALYTAGAGLHPSKTLPVSLDCGTDNDELLNDPLYLGYPKPRLRGEAYDAFVEAFVEAAARVFPEVVLQWEDFKQHNAIRLLDRYRKRIPSFNDDIQGTAAVVVAGILAALRLTGGRLADQRVAFVGAGAAGIGIARLLQTAMRKEGADEGAVRRSVVMLDSKGLLFEGREHLDDDKAPFAMSKTELARIGIEPGVRDLEGVVRQLSPTVLVGTSGTAGSFTEKAISEMADRVRRPIVLPLSNPTANSEATPEDVLRWTGGRAIVATGSPFDPVEVDGVARVIGQANNVFTFPGVGLGAIASRTREITDHMFLVAARALAGSVSSERLEQGVIYPRLSELRCISRTIAVAVGHEACRQGVARVEPEEVEAAVDSAVWVPEYSSAAAPDSLA